MDLPTRVRVPLNSLLAFANFVADVFAHSATGSLVENWLVAEVAGSRLLERFTAKCMAWSLCYAIVLLEQ
jgi:hypothetical protein